jgi:hypothetical protein
MSAEQRRGLALAIFKDAKPLAGTPGERYLIARSGTAPAVWPDDLRFHPRCRRRVDDHVEEHPAVVALLRDIHTDEPRAIQRIFLKTDGTDRLRDPKGKATLGSATGAVVKLTPDEDVTFGLGIIEGVEKGLAVLAAGWSPIWVTCGTSGMSSFPCLAGIEALSIFADSDESGQRAAHVAARRWAEDDKHVRIVTPATRGADWGDVLAGPAR